MTVLAWSFLPSQIEGAVAFVVLGSLAAMLVSVAKGGFGGSMGLLAMPVMIYACGGDTQFALGLTLPILIVCDQVSLASWWGKWNIRSALLLLPGAVGGVLVGTAAMWGLQHLARDGHERLMVGVLPNAVIGGHADVLNVVVRLHDEAKLSLLLG